MADIRIKDLTTTASSTASDDFIAVDGTTNGTRKLNAFSPTFGGNATVTGTLTAASNFSIASTGFYAGGGTPGAGRFLYSATAGSMLCGQGGSTYDLSLASSTGTTILGVPTGTNNVLIPATTASTTTSTGALVVGNGTSGGLGVGGAINCGGNIVLSPASVAASGEVGNLRIADSSNTNRKLFFGLDNTVSPNGVGYIQSTLTGSTTIPLQLQPLGGSLSVGNSGTVVTLNGTTASTSTSSGALVVSGGVGVAGAINAGGNIVTSQSSDPRVTVQRTALSLNTQSQIVLSQGSTLFGASDRTYQVLSNGESGTAAYFGVQYWDGSNYSLRLKIDSAGATTFGGSLTTSAPSGGTAAAWKLGTVASVSPTSPNRTIEVDIGGTIYYIHAKTTNN